MIYLSDSFYHNSIKDIFNTDDITSKKCSQEKLLYGYNDIIINAENKLKKIIDLYRNFNFKEQSSKTDSSDSESIFISISHGIGMYYSNLVPDEIIDIRSIKNKTNRTYFILLYYIIVKKDNKFYRTFSSSIPVEYEKISGNKISDIRLDHYNITDILKQSFTILGFP